MASQRADASSRTDVDGSSNPSVAAAGRNPDTCGTIAITPPFWWAQVIGFTVDASEMGSRRGPPLVWNKRPWYSNEQDGARSRGARARRLDERVVNWSRESEQRPGEGLGGKGGGDEGKRSGGHQAVGVGQRPRGRLLCGPGAEDQGDDQVEPAV